MKILGIDNGYSYTKDSESNMFKSAFSMSDEYSSGTIRLNINGIDYSVGTGETTCDVDKSNSVINMVCTFADLCQFDCEHDFKLVVGLPIGQYNAKREQFKESILTYNNCKVRYKGIDRRICIEDVIVAAQGVAALNTVDVSDCVLVDVGGITIDIAQVEMTCNGIAIVKSDTIYKGMRTLYNKIIESVNMKYNLRLEAEYAEKILNSGLEYKGVYQDLSFLKPVILDYINPIVEQLRLNYRVDINPVVMLGGGSRILYNAFNKRFTNVQLIKDFQFANANGYKMIGLQKWGH